MTTLLQEAATRIDLPSVRDWKAKGGKVVGYTCSFVPVEVFYAAGILPIRQRGIQTESLDIGDAYYGPFVCTFPKAVLQLAGSGAYDFLDGVLISTGCDAMRRLDECWRKMGQDIPGSVPEWFHYFDVPHKPDGVAFEWYTGQVEKMMAALEEAFQVEITEEKLKDAIRRQNRVRKLLWDLEELRAETPSRISGTEAFEAVIAGTVLHRDLYIEALETLIADVRQRSSVFPADRKRLFLTGSICDDIELVRLMETAGALVVGENVCFGVRNRFEPVGEDGDPVKALAAHYLSGSVCPRMFGWYQARRDMVIKRIQQVKADGVVMQNIRFCDLHGSENGLMEKDLENLGVPVMRIEKEYGPLTEKGRLRMRLDAFLEQLGS